MDGDEGGESEWWTSTVLALVEGPEGVRFGLAGAMVVILRASLALPA